MLDLLFDLPALIVLLLHPQRPLRGLPRGRRDVVVVPVPRLLCVHLVEVVEEAAPAPILLLAAAVLAGKRLLGALVLDGDVILDGVLWMRGKF